MSDLQILIVHAHASMRQAIRLALLEDDGLSFCEAENIETAQLMCGIQNFDVVISGRHFDKQNWSHLYHYLRPANAHKPHERFILIGNLGPIDRLRAIFNGIDKIEPKSLFDSQAANRLIASVEGRSAA